MLSAQQQNVFYQPSLPKGRLVECVWEMAVKSTRAFDCYDTKAAQRLRPPTPWWAHFVLHLGGLAGIKGATRC